MAKPQDPSAEYCATHDRHYGSIEQCPDCRAAAVGAPKQGSPKVETAQKRIHASDARLNAVGCWDRAKLLMAQDNDNVAVKWSDSAVKWTRVAMELEKEISEIEHDHWLRSEDTKRQGGGD